jgi:dienelactone hydrolase
MAITGEWIRYGEGSGYFAKPEKATAPLPGVLVIQEVGGVNEHIEDVTRRIAAAGYAALAPDLFAADGKRPEALTNERISEAFGFGAKLPPGAMAVYSEKIAGITRPVIAFYGAKDQRVNAGIPGFLEAMRAAGKSFEYRVYEGAGHAFFNVDSPGYDAKAVRDSYSRLLAFFMKTLSG